MLCFMSMLYQVSILETLGSDRERERINEHMGEWSENDWTLTTVSVSLTQSGAMHYFYWSKQD